MHKVFGQIQDALSKVLNKNDKNGMDSPAFTDLVTTITDNKFLMDEYCVALRKKSIVTNFACKEYLFTFIAENRERIEEQYFISKSIKNNSSRSARPTLTKNSPNIFGSAKQLCNMILKSCRDEITHAANQERSINAKKQAPELSLNKRRSAIGKMERNALINFQRERHFA